MQAMQGQFNWRPGSEYPEVANNKDKLIIIFVTKYNEDLIRVGTLHGLNIYEIAMKRDLRFYSASIFAMELKREIAVVHFRNVIRWAFLTDINTITYDEMKET